MSLSSSCLCSRICVGQCTCSSVVKTDPGLTLQLHVDHKFFIYWYTDSLTHIRPTLCTLRRSSPASVQTAYHCVCHATSLLLGIQHMELLPVHIHVHIPIVMILYRLLCPISVMNCFIITCWPLPSNQSLPVVG